MIAGGLCLMGGCFAQNENGMPMDCYWPAEYVTPPTYESSIALYQHDVVPAGVELKDCHVFTRQISLEPITSLFYVFQNDRIAYNCYTNDVNGGRVDIQTNTTATNGFYETFPAEVEFSADESGARCPLQGLSSAPCIWNSSITGSRLRMLDARSGKKQFFVTHGQWGYKWYLLPMRSVLNAEAVFDIEEKVLVEF